MKPSSADNAYNITEYCIKHGDALAKELEALSTKAALNPILKSHYNDALTDEVRQHVAKALGLSYEEVAHVIDYYFIDKYMKV